MMDINIRHHTTTTMICFNNTGSSGPEAAVSNEVEECLAVLFMDEVDKIIILGKFY